MGVQTTMQRAVVVGSGSGGRTAALELAAAGLEVVVVEQGRVGGECQYVACVPSKVLLLAARRGLGWAAALAAREEATDGRDDAASVRGLTEAGVEVVRGRGRLAGPRRVEIEEDGDRRVLEADVVVLAPGSEPARPPVDGLDDVPVWTSDEALSAAELPASLVVLGGGAVGCELAQAFSGLGCQITLVEVAPGLLPAEELFVGEAVAERLGRDGVRVLVGSSATRARQAGTDVVLELDDGTQVSAERVLLAGGRRPLTDDLGLGTVGVEPESGHLPVDARCRVLVDGAPLDWLYAVGDATAESSYTHSANDQGRVVAREVSGHGVDADYRGVPRVVFTEPAVWCTGLTVETAEEQGIAVRRAEIDLADVERGALEALVARHAGVVPDQGRLALLVERDTEVLVGVAVVGPTADGWAGELGAAVRHGLTVDDLLAVERGFLTWSEAVRPVLEDLARQRSS